MGLVYFMSLILNLTAELYFLWSFFVLNSCQPFQGLVPVSKRLKAPNYEGLSKSSRPDLFLFRMKLD